MTESKRKQKKSSNQELIITLGAVLGVVISAVILTILAKQFVFKTDDSGNSEMDKALGTDLQAPKQEYSMQQAYQTCKSELESRLGDTLKSMRYDTRSSRFNQGQNHFTVFYNLDIRLRSGKTVDSWAYCHVSSVTGAIKEYRVKGEGNRYLDF